MLAKIMQDSNTNIVLFINSFTCWGSLLSGMINNTTESKCIAAQDACKKHQGQQYRSFR